MAFAQAGLDPGLIEALLPECRRFCDSDQDKRNTQLSVPIGRCGGVEISGRALEGIFVCEDLHNIGPDYDPTLMAWWENFDRTYSDAFGHGATGPTGSLMTSW